MIEPLPMSCNPVITNLHLITRLVDSSVIACQRSSKCAACIKANQQYSFPLQVLLQDHNLPQRHYHHNGAVSESFFKFKSMCRCCILPSQKVVRDRRFHEYEKPLRYFPHLLSPRSSWVDNAGKMAAAPIIWASNMWVFIRHERGRPPAAQTVRSGRWLHTPLPVAQLE